MSATTIELYRDMARVRAYEVAIAELWRRGKISGEMHLGTGEEAVNVGVARHLQDGDAVALDHRGTPMMLLRGVDPRSLLREMMGHEDGLCRGRGGHMHLFAPDRLAASSGMVGASGPLAAGFALAAKRLRKRAIAVAFFGDGAVNEGQLMESFNLAVAWNLPVLFVCKDNGWAITTRSTDVTGGTLAKRAEGFGLPVVEVDGLDVDSVVEGAGDAIDTIRRGQGPAFLLAEVSRLDGHYLGDPLVRMAGSPIKEGGDTFRKAMTAATSAGGGGIAARVRSMAGMVTTLHAARKDKRGAKRDPLEVIRKRLHRHRDELDRIDSQVRSEVEDHVRTVQQGATP
jgi:pyruvate dehydrogenase E1 component alpha subunit